MAMVHERGECQSWSFLLPEGCGETESGEMQHELEPIEPSKAYLSAQVESATGS